MVSTMATATDGQPLAERGRSDPPGVATDGQPVASPVVSDQPVVADDIGARIRAIGGPRRPSGWHPKSLEEALVVAQARVARLQKLVYRHRYCARCRTPFPRTWYFQIYCSDACREVASRAGQNRRRRERRAAARLVQRDPVICLSCKQPFIPGRSDQRYCTSLCRGRAFRLR
jgi:predicted nucleic acid-binding Zn ribbon protein